MQLKKELEGLGGGGWFNKHYPAVPLALSSIAKGIKTPQSGVDWLMQSQAWFFKQNAFDFYWPVSELERVRKRLLAENSRSPGFARRLIAEWLPDYEKVMRFALDETRKLRDLSDEEFEAAVKELDEIHSRASYLPHLADCLLETGETAWIRAEISSAFPKETPTEEKKDEIELLTAPTTLTFVREEYLELIGIAKQRSEIPARELSTLLEKHVAKWFWIENNYRSRKRLDSAYFETKMNSLTNEELKTGLLEEKKRLEELRRKKLDVCRARSLGRKTENLLEIVDALAWLQDTRKKMNIAAAHAWFEVRDEITRRTRLSEDEANYLKAWEVEAALRNEVDAKLLQQRKQDGMALISIGTRLFELEAREASEIERVYASTPATATEVRGTVASKGKAVGPAILLLNLHAMPRVQRGDVIVANQTTPEYVPVLKKAAAIVTDQGGLTCHAAIVSRELGVPCIIGTKNATKIFRDGDLIEVDAIKGVAKIIRRAQEK